MTVGFLEGRERSPGPCAYNAVLHINPAGKYVASNYKNSVVRSFDPSGSKRFISTYFRMRWNTCSRHQTACSRSGCLCT